jgi:hypothetical protein
MEQSAAVRTREIYRSPNGDRWLLAAVLKPVGCLSGMSPIFPQVDRSWTLRSESHCSRQRTGEARILRLIGTLV